MNTRTKLSSFFFHSDSLLLVAASEIISFPSSFILFHIKRKTFSRFSIKVFKFFWVTVMHFPWNKNENSSFKLRKVSYCFIIYYFHRSCSFSFDWKVLLFILFVTCWVKAIFLHYCKCFERLFDSFWGRSQMPSNFFGMVWVCLTASYRKKIFILKFCHRVGVKNPFLVDIICEQPLCCSMKNKQFLFHDIFSKIIFKWENFKHFLNEKLFEREDEKIVFKTL